MRKEWIKKRIKWANEKIRAYCGPDYFFKFNEETDKFEFWEHRGPLTQMVFPLDVGNRPLRDITDWELQHAIHFVRKVRNPEAQENYYKYKEYDKVLKPKEYVDWRSKEDDSKWVNSSPYPKNYKKRKVTIYEDTSAL